VPDRDADARAQGQSLPLHHDPARHPAADAAAPLPAPQGARAGHRWSSRPEEPGHCGFLDELQPEPPLLPDDEALPGRVEEAEGWGDEVFQMAARRTTLAAALHGPEMLIDRGNDGRLGPLLWRHARTRLVGARLVTRTVFNVNQRTERKLLAELPGLLDLIDGWIEAGLLYGERLYSADYMIAPSLALLIYRRDLGPEIQERPAGALVDRILPEPPRSSGK